MRQLLSATIIGVLLIALPDTEACAQTLQQCKQENAALWAKNKALQSKEFHQAHLVQALRGKIRRLEAEIKKLRSAKKSPSKKKNLQYCICNAKFLGKMQKWTLKMNKKIRTMYSLQNVAGCLFRDRPKKRKILLCHRINVMLIRKIWNKTKAPNGQCKTGQFRNCRPANAKFLRKIWQQALKSQRLVESMYKLRNSNSSTAITKKLSLCLKINRIIALKINKRLY